MHYCKENPQSGCGHRNGNRGHLHFLLPQDSLRSHHISHSKLFQASFQERMMSRGSSLYIHSTEYSGTYRNLEDSSRIESEPDPLTYLCLVRVVQEATSR